MLALAITSTVSTMVTIGARVYYAMAKNRALSGGDEVDPTWRTPVAIIAQGVCAMLMTLTPFPSMIYISSADVFGAAVASVFVFRRAGLAPVAGAEFCLSVDSGGLRAGGYGHVFLRNDLAAESVVCGAWHDCAGRVGVPVYVSAHGACRLVRCVAAMMIQKILIDRFAPREALAYSVPVRDPGLA